VSHDEFPDLTTGEYAVIRMPEAWHVVSLLCFLAAVGARFLTALIPRELSPLFYRPLLTAFAVPVLALLGILFGLLGLMSPEGRSTARVALFLNGVTFVIGVAVLAAFYWILPHR
jgi:uncharacterized membrane protein YjjP (DUF1212 family)